MFLQHLNDAERKAFLVLAKEFILVDGSLSPEEESLLEVMKIEMGIDDSGDAAHKSRKELFAMFTTRKSQIAALIEMQGLGYANLEYHIDEKEFVNQMAEAFEVSKSELLKIDEWVIKQVALLYEANSFWVEDADFYL